MQTKRKLWVRLRTVSKRLDILPHVKFFHLGLAERHLSKMFLATDPTREMLGLGEGGSFFLVSVLLDPPGPSLVIP